MQRRLLLALLLAALAALLQAKKAADPTYECITGDKTDGTAPKVKGCKMCGFAIYKEGGKDKVYKTCVKKDKCDEDKKVKDYKKNKKAVFKCCCGPLCNAGKTQAEYDKIKECKKDSGKKGDNKGDNQGDNKGKGGKNKSKSARHTGAISLTAVAALLPIAAAFLP